VVIVSGAGAGAEVLAKYFGLWPATVYLAICQQFIL